MSPTFAQKKERRYLALADQICVARHRVTTEANALRLDVHADALRVSDEVAPNAETNTVTLRIALPMRKRRGAWIVEPEGASAAPRINSALVRAIGSAMRWNEQRARFHAVG